MKLLGKEMRIGAVMVTTREKGVYVSFFVPAQTEESRNTVKRYIERWAGKDFSVEIRGAAAAEENLAPWRDQKQKSEEAAV